MEMKLNEEFSAWIERESAKLVNRVRDLTNQFPRSIGQVHPDRHVKSFGPDDITGEISISITDGAGRTTTQLFRHNGRELGLDTHAMAEAEGIVERICIRKEFRDVISRETVLKELLEYVSAIARQRQTPLMSERLIGLFAEKVRSVSVWVPIEDVSVDRPFQFANATLYSVSKSEIESILEEGCAIPANDSEVAARDALRTKLYEEWAGQTVMRFQFIAEPERAEELAHEQAADYMALLQLFTPAAMVLSLTSHAAPRGSRPYRMKEAIVFALNSFQMRSAISEESRDLLIDAEQRSLMDLMGVATLSSLADGPTCEYEEKLLSSLLVYGRACYQLDPNDKLLQVMTSVEMFALRSDSEPIQAALADRIAFAVSEQPASRQRIAQNLREAYAARSGRSHHGRSIENTEVVEEFLSHALGFFIYAIQGVGRFKTRLEFLDQLDGAKYGHPML
jgi:hypothetical protein